VPHEDHDKAAQEKRGCELHVRGGRRHNMEGTRLKQRRSKNLITTRQLRGAMWGYKITAQGIDLIESSESAK